MGHWDTFSFRFYLMNFAFVRTDYSVDLKIDAIVVAEDYPPQNSPRTPEWNEPLRESRMQISARTIRKIFVLNSSN